MNKAQAIELTNQTYDDVKIGNYQSAKVKLEKALSLADDIPETHLLYSLVLSSLGNRKKAWEHINKTALLAPQNSQFWNKQSDLLEDSTALRDLMNRAKAIQLTNQAHDYVDQGNYQAARAKLEEALALNNNIPEAHSEYSLVLSFLGNIKIARNHINKAVLLAPQIPKFWSNLGNILFESGEYSAALRCILVAKRIDPKYRMIKFAQKLIKKSMNASRSEIKKHSLLVKEFCESKKLITDEASLTQKDLDYFLYVELPQISTKQFPVRLVLFVVISILIVFLLFYKLLK